jgi:tetratricopeptide (TPR) repeat protein
MNSGRFKLLSCLIIALAVSSSAAQAQAVHAWEGTITIPTYKLGPADPDPPFPLTNSTPVYPYTVLDDLTDDRAPETYKAIYIENEYLKLTVLPQLGGHLYSIYDKVDHREVLYRNNVVKYGLVGPRGAWISGGMEFSFPFAHTMDTVSPVECALHHNSDGSATVIVGAVDWVSNMHWEIALTLHPNTARVQEDVTLFNSTPQQHLYLFWTNTAVKATNDLQYIYPLRETIDDNPFAVVQSWPVWNGVDQSWYKNVAPAMAIFGRDVQRDFFGAYYRDSDYGVVHVANFRQDPGKKIWSWGTAPSGKIWDNILSDKDGSYNEIQSGRFYTQGFREFMEPRQVEKWTEYWYPVHGLKDGFVEATSKLAINVNYLGENGDKPRALLMISPVSGVSGATLVVKQGGKLLRELHEIHLVPMQTTTYTIPLENVEAAKKDLDIQIKSATGESLLHWSAAEPLDGNSDFTARAGTNLASEIPDSPKTPTEALYLRGEFLQKTGNLQGALKVYDEVLQRDPENVPALLREAWYHYEAADFGQADGLIAKALHREETNPSIQYAAGVISRAEGRLSLAKDGFWTTIHYGGPPASAFVELGEIEVREGNYVKAADLLKRAISYNPEDAFALADLAVAERLAGNLHDAAEASAKALEIMPLLPYALAERFQLQQAIGAKATASVQADSSWTSVINSDSQNYLAIASWYHSLGAWQSSDAVLRFAKASLPAQEISPMFDYYLSSDARQEGQAQEADRYAQTAAASKATSVFPNRLEDFAVLKEALDHNPADEQAQYAMGNFLFAHDRHEEAADLWQKALKEGLGNSVVLRNLGTYEWRVKNDLPSAAGYYSRAIQLSPGEYRLYPDLDEIYEEQGNTAARTELFQKAPQTVLDRDTVRARHALLFMSQEHYDQALGLLTKHRFKPWEGGVLIHNMYVSAKMENGKKALTEHHPEEAAQAFRDAMLYPENLGTGEPSHSDTSEQDYWLGIALEAAGNHAKAESAWKDGAAQGESGTRESRVFSALADQKLGNDDAARKMLLQCIQIAERPEANAADYFYAGLAEQYSHNTELARRDFNQAIQVDPLFWQARIALREIN